MKNDSGNTSVESISFDDAGVSKNNSPIINYHV